MLTHILSDLTAFTLLLLLTLLTCYDNKVPGTNGCWLN